MDQLKKRKQRRTNENTSMCEKAKEAIAIVSIGQRRSQEKLKVMLKFGSLTAMFTETNLRTH